MYNQKLHLHFVGIGGVGMAGIAEILINLGYRVSGSDVKENNLTNHLVKLGAEILIGHKAENIADTVTVVIRSSAIGFDNVELKKAKAKIIPIISRAEMLAELMRMKYGIAIAGSHGKTTTTSMTARILSEIGFDPTVVVGGRVLNQATGAQLGTGQYFVAEADESDGSFCLLNPSIAVVTNIDQEHLGHYGDFETLKNSFVSFMNSVPFYGLVVACIDDPVVESVLHHVERRVLTYGFSEKADVRGHSLVQKGRSSYYKLSINGCDVAEVNLPMAGVHMVLNSLAAIGVSIELGSYPEEASKALSAFPGVSRRTEEIANEGGILVLDDYGHHPTEIKATLAAVKDSLLPEHSSNSSLAKLVVLFEPHRYSRTQEVFSQFADAFKDADLVYVGDIYSAGEEPIEGISAQSLVDSLKHSRVKYVGQLKNSFSDFLPLLNSGDVVLTLGAGTVGRLGPLLAEELRLSKKS